MKIKKVLVLYKKTAYSVYKGENIIGGRSARTSLLKGEHERLRKAHEEHHLTYEFVKKALNEFEIPYKAYYRGRQIPFEDFDLVLTIGGDGTFLRASSYIRKQLIIGINSATSYSVGRLCSTNTQNFKKKFTEVLKGTHKEKLLQRLSLKVEGRSADIQVLNDVLISHSNPAVLSRYSLLLGGRREEQRSSGIWVSTAVGSSGAIGSAGGKLLSPYAKKFQYLPRELYQGLHKTYQLKGGMINSRQVLNIVSLMPKGRIYIDGGQNRVDFPYGKKIQIKLSKYPIRTLQL